MRSNKKIICTIGPSSFKTSVIKNLKKLKVNLFRINMSHTSVKDLKKRINFLKIVGKNKICIDTEGAQVRNTKILKKKFLKKNSLIKIYNDNFTCDSKKIFLYPKFNLNSIKVNALIHIGFEGLVLKVTKKNNKEDFLQAKVVTSGLIESNKGVHINTNLELDALTQKDIEAVKYGLKKGIKNFALSFVNKAEDVLQFRKLIGKKSFLISKIETRNAVNNLKKICKLSNAILIDRGDLSRYIALEKIPIVQEYIIKNAKKYNTPVYVATNLLETMIFNAKPTRAESHDIYSTLKEGASGLVLAAETAIGKYPEKCVMYVKKAIDAFEKKVF